MEMSSFSSGIVAVDLFCGVGGLTRGLQNEGIQVVAGYDLDESCRYAYETNNDAEFVVADVDKIEISEIKKRFEGAKFKVIVGCAPCQPFSSYAKNKKKAQEYSLLKSFAHIVTEILPDVVSMENVPRLKSQKAFQEFVSTLEEAGYKVDTQIVPCVEYGIPQTRRRLVLLASLTEGIKLIEQTHLIPITVKEIIGDLPKLNAGESSEDPLHRCRSLTKVNMDRLKVSKPGGSWESWPKHLKLECHKKSAGASFKSVYGRMRWDEPSPTMTTQFFNPGTGRFGHPEQDRAISLREAARFQTFPDDYAFVQPGKKFSMQALGRHIGNAVPVRLGEVIAKSIQAHLSEII